MISLYIIFFTITMLLIIYLHISLILSEKNLKIMEAQVGSILKETDIVRYKDIYGRVK